MSGYKKLEVWKRSHGVVLEIYKVVGKFPDSERFALASQMTRAAVSIPSNIAEGYGNLHAKILIRHLGIARGSANELEYQLLLARDLGYLGNEQHAVLAEEILEIKKMLSGFINSVLAKLEGKPKK